MEEKISDDTIRINTGSITLTWPKKQDLKRQGCDDDMAKIKDVNRCGQCRKETI